MSHIRLVFSIQQVRQRDDLLGMESSNNGIMVIRSRGLWSIETPFLSTNGCLSRVLLGHISSIIWKRQREMVPWSPSSLSRCPLFDCRHTSWSTRWSQCGRKTCSAKTTTNQLRRRWTIGTRIGCCQIRWVLCFDAKGIEECFRWSHCRRARATHQEKVKEVSSLVDGLHFSYHHTHTHTRSHTQTHAHTHTSHAQQHRT